MSPAPAEAAPALALAATWAAACRSAFGAPRWASAFRDQRPWASADPKQRRRWVAYARLALRLQEWGADPKEFCVAVAEHFARYRRAGTMRAPNPTQVSGDWGWRIWWEWRTERLALGPQVPAARAAGNLATLDDQVKVDIRAAYAECQHSGALGGLSLTSRPEVLWLFRLQEPAARQVLAGWLADAGDPDVARVRAGMARVSASPKLQRWLLRLWREAVGFRRERLSVLPGVPLLPAERRPYLQIGQRRG